jgi:hypothetical protein
VASAARSTVPIGAAAIPRLRGLRGGKRRSEDGCNEGCSTEASFSHFYFPFLQAGGTGEITGSGIAASLRQIVWDFEP